MRAWKSGRFRVLFKATPERAAAEFGDFLYSTD